MLVVSLLRIWNETTAALVTTGYGLFHIEAEIVAAIIIAIIFNHQLNTSTHTESRVYWLRVLFAQFMYCVTSVFRVLVNVGILTNSPMVSYTILALNFMSMHFAAWLAFVYVEVAQNSWLAGSLKNKILTAVPIIIEMAIFIFAPISGVTITSLSGSVKIGSLFVFMMTIAPSYYLAATILAAVRRAKMSRYERDTTSAIGIYPAVLFVVICIQAFNWKIPLFCNAIMIADVYIYIKYSDSLVSIDPLTKIPNRNGLNAFLAEAIRKFSTTEKVQEKDLDSDEEEEIRKELYVFALDVDGLNDINTNYGEIDGDKVLVIVANALKKFSEEAHECFFSRYYGDEFVLVAEIAGKNEFDIFVEHVRNYVNNAAITKRLPYHLRVNIGYAKYEKFTKLETVSGLIEEAARVLNENKEQRKFQVYWENSNSVGGVQFNEKKHNDYINDTFINNFIDNSRRLYGNN